MKRDKLWYLKRINLFKELPSECMHMIENMTKMKKFARKEVIYFSGEHGECVYFLKSGRVRLYRILEDGKELTLDYLDPGDTFGELSILEGYTHETVAEAVEEAYICMMKKDDFERLLKDYPSLVFQVTKLIGARLRKIESKIGELVYKDVPKKLAYILLRLADSYGVRDSRGILLRVKMSHRELASLIGSSRETVSLVMGEFKDKGLIENWNRQIIIKDMESLSSL